MAWTLASWLASARSVQIFLAVAGGAMNGFLVAYIYMKHLGSPLIMVMLEWMVSLPSSRPMSRRMKKPGLTAFLQDLHPARVYRGGSRHSTYWEADDQEEVACRIHSSRRRVLWPVSGHHHDSRHSRSAGSLRGASQGIDWYMHPEASNGRGFHR